MIQRIIDYFQKSIRTKLMVLMPIAISALLIFMFILTIITMRRQVIGELAEHGKKQLDFLSKHLDQIGPHKKLDEAFFADDILYFEEYDNNLRLRYQRNDPEKQRDTKILSQAVLSEDDGFIVKKISGTKGDALELEKKTDTGFVLLGISMAPVRKLLILQTIILLGICIITVFATFVIATSLGYLISDPLCKLAHEAEEHAEEANALRPLSSTERKDEVGFLARSLNHLLATIGRQQNEINTQKVHAAIGKISAQVVHDIRGPLSSLESAMNYLYNLKVNDKKYSDYLNLLTLSSKRLTKISNNLLAKYRGFEEKSQLFSLHRILDELIGEYQSRPDCATISFVKQYGKEHIELYGNESNLERAVGNIIKNACEAMEGAGTITITTTLNQNNEVLVSIEDTGKGMSDEVLRRVLEEGYSHGKDNGHGIGMIQVKETVREFKGKLSAQSIVGKGTTFGMNFPLPSSDVFFDREHDSHKLPLFPLAVREGEPIIVIDDDMSVLEQWRLLLEKHGVKTITCDSYEDFVHQGLLPMISKTAIVDYHFENSELNGMEIVEKLQKQGFERLYICTAEYWKPQVQERARLLSCTICPKPIPEIEVYTISEDDPLENPATKRVLLVNDDDSQRLTLRLMLEEKEGFSIDEAKTLHEAKAKLPSHRRSIIISDVNLEDPYGDGFDLLAFSKALGHEGKFYLYSGFRKTTYTERAQALGADGFYEVPLAKDTIDSMLM